MTEESNAAYSKIYASALAIYPDVKFCSFRIPGCKLPHFYHTFKLKTPASF
jgi:hypothetical protein